MSPVTNSNIVFENVSKFYGEVLGVNNVSLSLPPGVTSLVGPNGSGKTTLMNLVTGLVRPTQGRVTGFEFINQSLRLRGLTGSEAARLTTEAIQRVNLSDSAHRRVAGYSKGM